MATFDLKGYARRGAEARVAELTAELKAIYGAFPDLRQPRRGRQPGSTSSALAAGPGRGSEVGNGRATASDAPRRRSWKMSPAQKKAVGERMKKYWAARRAAGAGGKKR